MNLYSIGLAFRKLNYQRKNIDYLYEPRMLTQSQSNFKRNVYFKDCIHDFSEEVSLFGFSPFIMKTVKEQQMDKGIIHYKNKLFHDGLLNFVHKKNKINKQIKSKKITVADLKKKKSVLNRLSNINMGSRLLIKLNKEEELQDDISITDNTKRKYSISYKKLTENKSKPLSLSTKSLHKVPSKQIKFSLKDQVNSKFFYHKVISSDLSLSKRNYLSPGKQRRAKIDKMQLAIERSPTSLFGRAKVIGRVNLSF